MKRQARQHNTTVPPARRQAIRMLENICPHQFKARRVRNIVHRTVLKSKTKEFTLALDNVLLAVDQVHDLSEQLTAINPHLEKAQRDGTLARRHNEAIGHLMNSWERLIAFV